MFTEAGKCLGKGGGGKKIRKGGEKFKKKKGHQKKFWEIRGKKGELRTIKGNFFNQQQLYHMYCYGSVPCIYRHGA